MNPQVRVGILTALPLEAEAVIGVFDEVYDGTNARTYGNQQKNPVGRPLGLMSSTMGKIGRHDVVLAYMPGMGKVNAAGMASNLRDTFNELDIVLLLGVCGAVPNGKDGREIALGDIIIGSSVIQYDFGSQYPEGFVTKSTGGNYPGKQGREIQSFLSKLESSNGKLQEATSTNLASLLSKSSFMRFEYPGAYEDRLFLTEYLHQHHNSNDCGCRGDETCLAAKQSSCGQLGCDPRMVMIRGVSSDDRAKKPSIHHGPFASGDTVMKSAKHRDEIATKEKVIAFDMESAGIWDSLPCLIVKGVSDYADSHKSEVWQPYAAATAASCAKAILEFWNGRDRQESSTVGQHSRNVDDNC